MSEIAASELVLNPDGSVYHLHLRPDQLADTVVLVGDQGRVEKFSRHFDTLECQVRNREFITHTGWYKGRRLSILSTGIGTDNIDIVVNELDALVNIDLGTREVRPAKTALRLIRVGTCGVIRPGIDTGETVISAMACGFDGLLRFYGAHETVTRPDMEAAFAAHMGWDPRLALPYFTPAHPQLFGHMQAGHRPGVTISAPGFYGPQGRVLRLSLIDPLLHDKLRKFEFDGLQITNFEMECSALYGLSNLLGHQAVTICAVVANRATGQFDQNYQQTMDRLIVKTLDQLAEL